MNPIRRVLRMANESTAGRYWIVLFLASVDLVCVFEAGDSIREGHIEAGVIWLAAAVGFSLIGFYWPALRKRGARYFNSRLAWTVVFTLCSLYLLQKRSVLDYMMTLHQKRGGWGYPIAAIVGAALLTGYWWLTGALLKPHTAGETTAQPTQTSESKPAQHFDRTVTETLTTEETSDPLGHLAHLGWGIKDEKDATVFEVANKALPDGEQSAKYFGGLKKPFRLQLQQVPSLAGLHHLAGIKNCFRIDIGASNINSLSELSGMTNLRELAVGQTPFTDLGDLDISAVSTLANLDNLVFTNSRVRTIDSVRKLRKLTKLSIHASLVDDLSPVSNLHLLKSVVIRESRVTDLTPLSGIAGLEEMVVDGKQVRGLSAVPQIKRLTVIDQAPVDLTALSSLSNLTYLSIWGPPSLDFSPLRNLGKLTELQAMGPMLGQLSAVNNLDAIRALKLNTLVLSGMKVTSLDFLNGNSTITNLTLNSMPITNAAELGTMASLRKLTLFDVPIVDISPLLSSPKLREVSFLRVPARADVISQLQRNGVKVTNN